jgi:hypothetical protein
MIPKMECRDNILVFSIEKGQVNSLRGNQVRTDHVLSIYLLYAQEIQRLSNPMRWSTTLLLHPEIKILSKYQIEELHSTKSLMLVAIVVNGEKWIRCPTKFQQPYCQETTQLPD